LRRGNVPGARARFAERRPGAAQSSANADIIAVPIATLVQASRRSAGCLLKRAAHVIGIAINPRPGRPPFSPMDLATSSDSSGERRSSCVSSETKSPTNREFASDTFLMKASTSRSSG
jgi:hypothetical protein